MYLTSSEYLASSAYRGTHAFRPDTFEVVQDWALEASILALSYTQEVHVLVREHATALMFVAQTHPQLQLKTTTLHRNTHCYQRPFAPRRSLELGLQL